MVSDKPPGTAPEIFDDYASQFIIPYTEWCAQVYKILKVDDDVYTEESLKAVTHQKILGIWRKVVGNKYLSHETCSWDVIKQNRIVWIWQKMIQVLILPAL
mgnify:CR=1 FL=1